MNSESEFAVVIAYYSCFDDRSYLITSWEVCIAIIISVNEYIYQLFTNIFTNIKKSL